MCTVTWHFEPGGFELFFNRDEMRSRATAEPPSPSSAAGTRYLAPTDRDAGGTWLAINEHGTAVGVLNAHPPGSSEPAEAISRGRLVRALADLPAAPQLAGRLAALDLQPLRPFTLFAVSTGGGVSVYSWDGSELRPHAVGDAPLLSSSSSDAAGAAAARARLLEEMLGEAGDPRRALAAFHASHLPERGPLSPCMHRRDARTVSFSRVRVAPGEVTIAYADGPPCRATASHHSRLVRRAGPPSEAATVAGAAPDAG